MNGLLKLIDDVGGDYLFMSRKEAYHRLHNPPDRRWEDYFPYSVESATDKLIRKGLVEVRETQAGRTVILTENGRKQVLIFDLENLKPKKLNWDGRWRMIFFDVMEVQRKKRDQLRKYLKQLGLLQMQESVWISPYDIRDEVKYLREILEIGDEVKWAVISDIENAEDLKKWFGIK